MLAEAFKRGTGARAHATGIGLIALMLAACAMPGMAGRSELQGVIQFEATRRTQATSQEVGTAATVSLIDPANSRTIATTLTKPDRSFTLAIPGFAPKTTTYILEAVKGLNSNAAGHDAARLRTLVRWDGTAWKALTTGDASIGIATTALAAIVGLRASFTPVNPDLLIGKLTLGTPDLFEDAGTGVTQAEFATVSDLASQSVAADRDPLAALRYDGTTYRLGAIAAAETRPFISSVRPDPASAGTPVTLMGGNFLPVPGDNAVTFNGVPLPVLSGDTRMLVVTLPSGASTGPLRVTTPDGVDSYTLTITPTVDGGVLPSTSSPLVPTTPGTDIPGSVFGR